MPTMLGRPRATQIAYTSAATRTAMRMPIISTPFGLPLSSPSLKRYPCAFETEGSQAQKGLHIETLLLGGVVDVVAVAHDGERRERVRLGRAARVDVQDRPPAHEQ